MAETADYTVRARAVLAEFLHQLPLLSPDEVVDAPGLPGRYLARQIRDGMATGAVVVHHTGLGLAVTAGPQTNEWFRRMDRELRAGPSMMADHPALPLGDRS